MSNQKEVSKDYIIERAETLGYCTEESILGHMGLCLAPKPCWIHDEERWRYSKYVDDELKRAAFIASV